MTKSLPTKEQLSTGLYKQQRSPLISKRNELLVEEYKNFTMTVEKLAIKYNITTRSVQRICKEYGVIRTIAEANRLAAPFKNYEGHKTPDYLKIKRKTLPKGLR